VNTNQNIQPTGTMGSLRAFCGRTTVRLCIAVAWLGVITAWAVMGVPVVVFLGAISLFFMGVDLGVRVASSDE
jgi:hypothetical protein